MKGAGEDDKYSEAATAGGFTGYFRRDIYATSTVTVLY